MIRKLIQLSKYLQFAHTKSNLYDQSITFSCRNCQYLIAGMDFIIITEHLNARAPLLLPTLIYQIL